MNSQGRLGGRPRAGDPDVISEIALELMARDGFGATTMEGIARASGVSAPTLFRYFPSKAAVLWHGMEENERTFRAEFDRRIQVPLIDRIFDAYAAMLQTEQRKTKARIAILAVDSDAAYASWSRYEEWRQLVTALVAESSGEPASSLRIRVFGSMVWAALWSAANEWGPSADADPAPYVSIARRCIPVADVPSSWSKE